jgi:hypothetical protein
MNAEDRKWYDGNSDVSFADAAKKAVENAEGQLDSPPTEYDVTLRVTATPGRSLSEYRVFVSPHT